MEKRNVFYSIVAFAIMLTLAMFTSCDKALEEFSLNVEPDSGPDTNTEVTITVTRDSENGKVTASKDVNGIRQDTTVIVPLGGVNFEISPLDTIKVNKPEVSSVSFAETGSNSGNWEAEGVSYTKTVKTYRHEMTGYLKDITISYLDAEMTLWGKKVVFPAANGSVAFEDGGISVVDEGIKDKVHYYLSTSSYKVAFMGGSRIERGYERLAMDADDVLQSTSKTDEGYETLSSTTAKSWVEITRTYSQSGSVVSRYEVILKNGIGAPAYEIRTVESFELEKKNAVSGETVVSGTRTEGNITVTAHTLDYTVGCDLFDKVFTPFWETAVLKVDGKEFEMPSRAYENITDKGFKLTEMSEKDNYERRLYTHTIGATFNGNSAEAVAEVELHKKAEDKLESQVIVEDGMEYVDATTTRSWIKIKEVWSVSGEKVYTKSVNLTNGINAPAKVIKILEDFTLNQISAVLGDEVLAETETVGDFTVRTYQRTYTVGNDKFNRIFTLSYQRAFYNPLDHSMPFAEYESVADNGFATADMTQITEEGKTYDRKSYTHSIGASFNGHPAEAKAEAELRGLASDIMTSQEIIEDGMDYVDDNTTRSWIKIKEIWTVSGEKTYVKSVDLTNGIAAPAKVTKILPSFALASATPSLAGESLLKTETVGDFTVKTYQRTYTVANNRFDRVFTLSYQRAVYDPLKHNMPNPEYENISDNGFETADLSQTVSGGKTYDRKSYAHTMGARFNGRDVSAVGEAELWVEVNDELKERTIVEDGKDYIDASTTKSWIKIKEIWSVSGEKVYTKSVNLKNSITAPAKITKVLENFNLIASAPSTGGEKLTGTQTVGDFKVMTYQRTYTVANDKFNRVFTLSYQKAIYSPLTHNMPYAEYENLADNGFKLSDMSRLTENGRIYDRKNYVHTMSAMFNGYPASAAGEAELRVFVSEDRDTPSWLGSPKSAKYTRVQQSVGAKFMDMIVFTYENGVVMAPNGKVDMNLCYAFDESVAAKNGVETCISGAYSGVWGANKWQPAKVTVVSGRWIYAGKSSAWDHTVMEKNAVTLGIGEDVTPTPGAQSYKITGNRITISYAVNNGSKTANTSLSLK